MKRTILAVALVLATPFVVQAQENVDVQAGDTSVHVGDDGVKVKVGDTQINVDASSVEVQSEGATGEASGMGVLNIEGVELVRQHTCDASHARTVHIDGSDNRVTLKGECDRVVISGTDNTVTIDGAARIVVSGVDNKVTYKRGAGGKPPVIQNTGVDNKVVKRAQK